MNRCPITYELCGNEKYLLRGIRLLSRRLTQFNDFPYTAEEQRKEAVYRAERMSIQGVQPKVSARINVAKHGFEIVEIGGHYILKPQNYHYDELPENEDVTMRMAAVAKIETPFHGLIYSKDGSKTYFIQRFDRKGRGKIPLEDFAQLAGKSRDTKYNYSIERMVDILEQYCTFPIIDKTKLFRRILFNYLVGNEDMHLKNFSLITRGNIIGLAPAYDFLNTTIVLPNPKEETALSLKGKKRNLKRNDFIDYFGQERLGLNPQTIDVVLSELHTVVPEWHRLLEISFLSSEMKEKYKVLLDSRCGMLG